MPQTGSLAMGVTSLPSLFQKREHGLPPSAHRIWLPAERSNHILSMHPQVCRMFRYDMLARLSVKRADERLQRVDRHRSLPTIERRLGGVELGDQTAGDPVIVDVPLVGRVLDARAEGLDGWGRGTIIHG